MAGIDYRQLRAVVSMRDVLNLISFSPTVARGNQVRGPCPLHGSKNLKSTSFSASLAKNAYRCFRCGAAGNQLDLWMAVTKLPLYEAAEELCRRLDLAAPRLVQEQRRGTRTKADHAAE
jgi:DNA primase